MKIKGEMNRSCRVYVVTHKTNGKRYIGITTRTIRRRFREHVYEAMRGRGNGRFYRAIRKYGWVSFKIAEVSFWPTVAAALAEEIRLIAETSPEYNSTIGGDGAAGRPFSEKARAALLVVHRGNKYRLGKTHSTETRKRLREAGLRDRKKWLERSWQGPDSVSKKVICLDDGVIYSSIAEAARRYGIGAGSLSELCCGQRGRRTLAGRRFSFWDSEDVVATKAKKRYGGCPPGAMGNL